jgi:enoyl-CoA hydratase
VKVSSLVNHTIEDGVVTIELHDPDRRNALTKELSDDLAAAVRTALEAGASDID